MAEGGLRLQPGGINISIYWVPVLGLFFLYRSLLIILELEALLDAHPNVNDIPEGFISFQLSEFRTQNLLTVENLICRQKWGLIAFSIHGRIIIL